MKIADRAPTYCAACHCQDAEKAHVDFEAYYDGPVVDGLTHKQPIDDLVLCEDCLGAGATLIGWIHNKRMRQENFELGRAIEEKDGYIQVLEKVISDLEHTLGLTLSGKVKRGQGRPTVRVPDNLDEIMKRREKEKEDLETLKDYAN